jgi:hypothetical protein
MFDEDGNMKKSERTKYREYRELDELAKKGCSTCETFRATILHHHPSNNAPEFLARDDDSLSAYLNLQSTAISINYLLKPDLEDFEYASEWSMGRPPLQAWSNDESSIMRKRSFFSTRLNMQASRAVGNVSLTMTAKDDCSFDQGW